MPWGARSFTRYLLNLTEGRDLGDEESETPSQTGDTLRDSPIWSPIFGVTFFVARASGYLVKSRLLTPSGTPAPLDTESKPSLIFFLVFRVSSWEAPMHNIEILTSLSPDRYSRVNSSISHSVITGV